MYVFMSFDNHIRGVVTSLG